ncbi:hypothetical protein C0995_002448, partial [Termitomyces sp. Mi166
MTQSLLVEDSAGAILAAMSLMLLEILAIIASSPMGFLFLTFAPNAADIHLV